MLLSGLVASVMVSCGSVSNLPSAQHTSSTPLLTAQNTIGEQVVTMEMLGTLQSASWISINTSRIVLGGVLAAGVHVALNNLVNDLLIEDSPLADDYLSLMNAEDKARIAEVFLLMEGLPNSITAARATMNDTAAFNQRVATAAGIVVSEKRDEVKKAFNLRDLFDIALSNTTTPPPPPNPGDPCNKGFPDVDKWADTSDFLTHFNKHAEDFKIDPTGATAEAKQAYLRAAGNFLKDATRARGVGFIVRSRLTNGDLIIGQSSTKYYGVFSRDGAAKTFYKWNAADGKTFANYVNGSSEDPTEKAKDDWYKGTKGQIDTDGKCQ